MKHIYLYIFLLLTCSSVGFAQQEITLQMMNNIYQSTHTNPAIVPRNKVSISLLSSYQLDVKNTGFSYNQLMAQVETNEEGQRVLNLASVMDNLRLSQKNYLHTGGSVDVFALGFKAGKGRFSLNLTEKFQGRLHYSDGLLRTAVEGNAPEQTIRLDDYAVNAIHYRELGLGYNRSILPDDKLVIGGRLKVLNGLANVRTQKSEIAIRTGSEAEMYALTATTDILVRTSGLDVLQEGDMAYFTNTGNLGLGLDAGATYQLDSRFSFAASLVNVGFINWKTNSKSYQSQGTFTFAGVDSDSLFNGGGFNVDMAQLADSVMKAFKFREDSRSYRSGLPAQIYLSAYYQLGMNTTASATLYSEFIGSFHKGLAVGIRQQAGRWLQTSLTYSMQARSYNNLGFGLSVNTGRNGLQLYLVSDNILGMMNVGGAKLLNARTGFNFVF